MANANTRRRGGDPRQQLHEVQRLTSKERLSLDEPAADRTCFLSHVGAQAKLVPGPWIGHRDLIYAMALANLSPTQRTSLARAVLVEHGREFGVGRLILQAAASGLPLGGSSLRLEQRTGGLSCLYTWALGTKPTPLPCDWVLLRAQPEWALPNAPRPLQAQGLSTLVALGGQVLVLVESAVGALQVAQTCAGKVPFTAHPRFAPYIDDLLPDTLQPDAAVLLWPHDALEGQGLARRKIAAVALVSAPESVRQAVTAWRERLGLEADPMEVVEVGCPGRANRSEIARFWEACGHPHILLRGDPAWAAVGSQWFGSLGAHVEVQGQATQLPLI